MGICGSLMDIFDYAQARSANKKHCFARLLDFTDYYGVQNPQNVLHDI